MSSNDEGQIMTIFEPVFILAGQSNMAGRCDQKDLPHAMIAGIVSDQAGKATTTTTSNDNDNDGSTPAPMTSTTSMATAITTTTIITPPKFHFCWNNDSNFGQASIGEWGDLQCQPSPGLQKILFGPEFGLAEALGKRFTKMTTTTSSSSLSSSPPPPKRVHFIKFAMGSTNLHSNWNPENTAYTTGDDNDNTAGTAIKPAKRAHYNEFITYCKNSLEKLQAMLDKEEQEEREDYDDDGDGNKNINSDEDDGEKATTTKTKMSPQTIQTQRRQDEAGGAPHTTKIVPRLVGMFWLQGESDSSKAKDAKNYLKHFQSFVNHVRNDLNVPNLPIVVSPVIWTKGKYTHIVNDALQKAGNGAVSFCTCIDHHGLQTTASTGNHTVTRRTEANISSGCRTATTGDAAAVGILQPPEAGPCADHLTAFAATEIGRRMGEAFPSESWPFQ